MLNKCANSPSLTGQSGSSIVARCVIKISTCLLLAIGVTSGAQAQEVINPNCTERNAVLWHEVENGEWSEFPTGLTFLYGDRIHSPAALLSEIQGVRLVDTDRSPKTTLMLIGGDFVGWDFTKIDQHLSDICFYRSKLSDSIWDGGTFSELGFIKSDLSGASFQGTRLAEITFENATLQSTSMRGARVEAGRLSGGWDGSVQNWNLSDAVLIGFRFDCGITIDHGCPLQRDGIKLVGAQLIDSDISEFLTWGYTDFDRATFIRTRVSPRQIPWLVGVTIKQSILLVGDERHVNLTSDEFGQVQSASKAYAEETSEPSFPCFMARKTSEHLICNEYQTELHALDRTMAKLYAYNRHKAPGILPAQRRWVRERDLCVEVDCVKALYARRIDELVGIEGEPEFLEPGQSAFYVQDTLGFPDSFIGTAIYAKIVPAVAGASRMSARITKEFDGTYSIIGEAIGANAHMCNLRGRSVEFDSNSGWFSVPGEDGGTVPLFQIIGDELTVIDDGKAALLPVMESAGYLSCGARASFSTMRRLRYDQDRLEMLIHFPDEQ